MDDYISLEGPVELVGKNLMIRIPLSEGGHELAPMAQGISYIADDCLCVVIPPWMAEKLRVREGSLVLVDNKDGKFTISRSEANDRATN